jgi:hypothetical protein
MKNWLRKRMAERSTRIGGAVVVVLVSIVGIDLSIDQQAHVATAINAVIAAVLILLPDKADKPE